VDRCLFLAKAIIKRLRNCVLVKPSISIPHIHTTFSVGSVKQVNILRDTILGYVQTGMIQHDACGFHGSSGGPLLDLQGRVLGINSYPGLQGYDVPGLTLAIPSNTIQKIVPKLISQHSYKHACLGVDVTDLTNLAVINHHYGRYPITCENIP
jgi:S1-C subfamily serine protease